MSDTLFDLAKLDNWQGVRPGMTRSEVQAALQQRGVEADAYGDDNLTAITDDWEMELHFSRDGADRLRQVSVDGVSIRWNGKPVLGLRLDDALRLIDSSASAHWQREDVTDKPFPDPLEAQTTPATSEQLLEEGTVWLPQRGLGLVIIEGQVFAIAWRASSDLPAQFAGPLTSEQRELSKRPDLEDYLQKKRHERFQLQQKRDPLTPLRTLVTIATIAALAFVGKKGFDEMRLWNQAPTINAKFIAVEPVPLTQFRGSLPPALKWMFPRPRRVMVDGYRVEFTAPDSTSPQQAVLERGEVYVAPREAGEEVPVVHVPGNPPRTKGLSRARDSAFLDYIPWAVAIGLLWLLTQFVIGLLPMVFRFAKPVAKQLTPSATVKDPDRPELR